MKKEFKFSEEARRKMSETHKRLGTKPPSFKGKYHPPETRKKMSESHKGLNTWMKGKHLSEETKKKIGVSSRGNKYALGYKHTEEAKIKIGNFFRGKNISNEQKKKLINSRIGKHHAEESKIKMSEARKGKYLREKSPNWKGGINPIADSIRKSSRYKDWRQKVFIRDHFTCQDCGQIGGYLEAHHNNKSFSELLQEVKENLPLFNLYDGAMIYEPLWETNNGKTLCNKCHIIKKS